MGLDKIVDKKSPVEVDSAGCVGTNCLPSSEQIVVTKNVEEIKNLTDKSCLPGDKNCRTLKQEEVDCKIDPNNPACIRSIHSTKPLQGKCFFGSLDPRCRDLPRKSITEFITPQKPKAPS